MPGVPRPSALASAPTPKGLPGPRRPLSSPRRRSPSDPRPASAGKALPMTTPKVHVVRPPRREEDKAAEMAEAAAQTRPLPDTM